jgi:hypothetical protein
MQTFQSIQQLNIQMSHIYVLRLFTMLVYIREYVSFCILHNLSSTAVNGDIFIKNLQGVPLHFHTYSCKHQTATYIMRLFWVDIA